ncbi:MAG: hypothetical protein AAB631_00715 [Patescibacteria group bacterium]
MEPQKLDIDELLGNARAKQWESKILKGDTYKNFSTIIVIATRGKSSTRAKCPHCDHSFEVEHYVGFHPWVVESWKRFIKPMNIPTMEMIVSGYEVGDAYEKAVGQILGQPELKNFRHILFLEDDIIVPFMDNSFGPLIELYKHMGKFDVASGLYWLKGEPSLPLTYGTGNFNVPNPFEVNMNWQPGDIVEVNGCGMGMTLMKRAIFEDPRIEKPFFRTVNEIKDGVARVYTQDLYFYEKIKKLGYKICVDTNIRCGHLDFQTEIIY